MTKPHTNKKSNTIYNKGQPRRAKRGNPPKYFLKDYILQKILSKICMV